MKFENRELDRRFTQAGFVQRRMNPIMRKTKMPPGPFMRKTALFIVKASLGRRQ